MSTETDRELLELVAKAAGIKALRDPHGVLRNCTSADPAMNIFALPIWNPRTDDGDSRRLAVKLEITVVHEGGCATAARWGITDKTETYQDDPCAATRRAVFRAAVEIGKAMR